jgi:hypothetical protein
MTTEGSGNGSNADWWRSWRPMSPAILGLMGEDEEGTHAALTALRRELSDPKIAAPRGRIPGL